MNRLVRFCVTALCSLCVVAAISAVPANHHSTAVAQAAAQTQSVSGKIASVEKESFTLTVASGTTHKLSQTAQAADPKTMVFQIDKNTTVEGKLKVNANADVTYREEGGKNIAVSVRVTP